MQQKKTERPPAVAGYFYPKSSDKLQQTVFQHICNAQTFSIKPKALIAPHAGIVYSGDIAGTIYKLIYQKAPHISKVILLGPSHHYAFDGIALPEVDSFRSPLGNIPLDKITMKSLLNFTQIKLLNHAHQPEHALELQLPFLQVCLSHFTIIPLLVGQAKPSEIAEILQFLWGGDETLIVISSDLSHYLSYNQAKVHDAKTKHNIEQFETTLNKNQACGYAPINGLLTYAKQKNMRIKSLDIRNSGDTAGDKNRVVGYGAFALY